MLAERVSFDDFGPESRIAKTFLETKKMPTIKVTISIGAYDFLVQDYGPTCINFNLNGLPLPSKMGALANPTIRWGQSRYVVKAFKVHKLYKPDLTEARLSRKITGLEANLVEQPELANSLIIKHETTGPIDLTNFEELGKRGLILMILPPAVLDIARDFMFDDLSKFISIWENRVPISFFDFGLHASNPRLIKQQLQKIAKPRLKFSRGKHRSRKAFSTNNIPEIRFYVDQLCKVSLNNGVSPYRI